MTEYASLLLQGLDGLVDLLVGAVAWLDRRLVLCLVAALLVLRVAAWAFRPPGLR